MILLFATGGALSDANLVSTGVEMYTESTGAFASVVALTQAVAGSCAAVVGTIVINIGGSDGGQETTVS